MADIAYKIVTKNLWQEAEETGVFKGAPIDIEDGFMHFSTSKQLRETAKKYFHGQKDLLLVAVNVDNGALAGHWKWDVSRGGALFPHLYVDLPLEEINWVQPLPLNENGEHLFPELEA